MRARTPLSIGRYVVYDELASGGMASVCLGRLLGPIGFSRTVAIKRMHPQYAKEPEFVAMFIDEARLAARIRHPNVVPTLDVVRTEAELFLVMDYVQGESLARLISRSREEGPTSPRIAVPIIIDALRGLEAAHTATSETGSALDIVHRDVSPQNIMVGIDGVARVFDFGIAKATIRLHTTRDGAIRGKLAYMPPEQLRGDVVTRQADIYAAAVVLWEVLAGRRLFEAEHEAQLVHHIIDGVRTPPSAHNTAVRLELDAVVMRALSTNAAERFKSAQDMATALEVLGPHAGPSEIGAWVSHHAGPSLKKRVERVQEIESQSDSSMTPDLDLVSGLVEGPTMTTRVEKEAKTAASGRALPLAFAVFLVAGGCLGYMMVRRLASTDAEPPGPALPARSSDGDVENPVSAPGTVEPPLVAPSVAPAGASGDVPSGPMTKSSGLPRSTGGAKAPVGRRAATACSPPYFYDSEGIKHPKPGCL